MAVVYVSNADPEWRVVAERGHLVVERQFHHPTNVEAVLTRCGMITTPSRVDRALRLDQVPKCRPCERLAEVNPHQPCAEHDGAHCSECETPWPCAPSKAQR